MTVFKYFLRLAWRQRMVIILYLILFLVIALLNSSFSRVPDDAFTLIRPSVRIIQNDQGPMASALAQYLREQGNEQFKNISEATAEEAIFNGAVSAVVIIPESFGEDFAENRPSLIVYTDDTQMPAIVLRQKIDQFLSFAKADEAARGTFDPVRVSRALAVTADVRLTGQDRAEGASIDLSWFRSYFNFITYMLIAVFILVFGNIMHEFNHDTLKRRNSIVPFSSTRFQVSLVAAQLVIAFAVTALFMTISLVLRPGEARHLDWTGHILNASAFTLAALALAFLINSLTRNRVIHTALSTVLSLGMAFISGVMIPQALMAPAVITLSKFFPSYYYVTATDQILTGSSYLSNVAVQLLFALFFLVLGLTAVRIRQGEDLFPARDLRPVRKSVS